MTRSFLWILSVYMVTNFNFVQVKKSTVYTLDPALCKEFPCLIFEDEFNRIDHKVWEHAKTAAYTGNKEFQYYTNNRSNSFTRDGVLYLKPTLTNNTFSDPFLYSGTLDLWGNSPSSSCTSNMYDGCVRKGDTDRIINPIQSASISTINSFTFTYGRMEVRAQLPRGDWIWPAVWMMPKYNVYGKWPASGEIDVMESRGNDVLQNGESDPRQVGNKMVSQSLHWGPYTYENGHPKTFTPRSIESGSFSSSFHTFSVEWTPFSIAFFIDDTLSFNVTVGDGGFWEFGEFDKSATNPWVEGDRMAPFDEEFFIIMNVAVGGNKFFDERFRPHKPWSSEPDAQKAMKEFWEGRKTWLPTWQGDDVALKIDYVRVWKLENSMTD